MTINVENMDMFLDEVSQGGTICILFSHPKSPQCKAMEYVLSSLEEKFKFKLVNVFIDNMSIADLVQKYNVGVLPKFVFVRDGVVLYSETGTQVKHILEKELRVL
jgi:thioredoxin-like negative regulator of GroEL